MNRRQFLTNAPATAAIGGALPGLWARAARAAGPGRDDRVLVVVELTGGNDGLNMVVPYRDDLYHKARPTLRVEPNKVLKLDDHLGLHPAMKDLHKLWEAGKLRVVMNAGYPRPNRSHFRSMEIWQSGGLGPTPTAGWLGLAADARPGGSPPCFVGQGTSPLAVQGRAVAPFAIADIEGLALRPGARLGTSDVPGDDPVDPAHRVARALAAAEMISKRAATARPGATVTEQGGLEARLATIAGLIAAGVGSRVYYTSLDGFDTHAGQQFAHQDLLRRLSEALARFQAGIAEKALDDRVAVVVFSEFGRRIEENGSKGTDHGAAAPLLVLGSPVAPGLAGGVPDLKNTIEGDVPFAVDFRDVYAGVLADWLGVDPSAVIPGRQAARLPLFRA
ncbi:hypothetical protein OJF2_08050 [Aquisphaera giovannonii]|uniref:DUF1501 domain-containing protein n=1 Tax=Aquisphaera giovannonii TaxID=406548 RepID=A0A5B9VX28_9BACT|nr:DUF1501 domain-containing protein [Aquisphaera giovannonii]QEH32335.1 hypothetical protein OJF2_08050 [Aquisphaera giovannonii]